MNPSEKPERRTRREISAGIIVFRRTRDGLKFLLLYHGHNYWNFPKGKIESEERSLAAAFRETREETGLTARDLRLLPGFRVNERFTFRRGNQSVFKIVIFFLAETRNPRIQVSAEHNGYAWYLFEDAKRTLTRYKDSERVLKTAYEFLRAPRRPQAEEKKEQK